MAEHRVCRVEELPEGGRRKVSVKGRDVALFNVRGELFAILDRCPHAGASLCDGQLTGLMHSEGPGDYRLTREGEILRCPWHRWEFDLRTGKSCAEPNRIFVRTYAVSVAGGGSVSPAEVAEAPAEQLETETFPVHVEGHWVVVEA